MLWSAAGSLLAMIPNGITCCSAHKLCWVSCVGAQILAGWIFSRGATLLVSGSYSRRIKILGWHPLNPSAETKSIAAATSAAAGIPEAAPALYAPEPPLPEGESASSPHCGALFLRAGTPDNLRNI